MEACSDSDGSQRMKPVGESPDISIFNCDVYTTTGTVAVKSATEIHVPQRTNPTTFQIP